MYHPAHGQSSLRCIVTKPSKSSLMMPRSLCRFDPGPLDGLLHLSRAPKWWARCEHGGLGSCYALGLASSEESWWSVLLPVVDLIKGTSSPSSQLQPHLWSGRHAGMCGQSEAPIRREYFMCYYWPCVKFSVLRTTDPDGQSGIRRKRRRPRAKWLLTKAGHAFHALHHLSCLSVSPPALHYLTWPTPSKHSPAACFLISHHCRCTGPFLLFYRVLHR